MKWWPIWLFYTVLLIGGGMYVQHQWQAARDLRVRLKASEAQTAQWVLVVGALDDQVVRLKRATRALQHVADSTATEADSALARYQRALAEHGPTDPVTIELGATGLTSCTVARRDCMRASAAKDTTIATLDSTVAARDSMAASLTATIDLLKAQQCRKILGFLPYPQFALGAGGYIGYGVTATPTGPVAGPQTGVGATLGAVIHLGGC